MKKINIFFILCAGLFAGCNKFLDEAPDNRAEIDTPDKITKLLVSAYPNRCSAYMFEMGSDNADKNSGNWVPLGLFQDQAFQWKDTEEHEEDTPDVLWEANYMAAAVSNQALAEIEKLGNPESLNPQKGEALICRAFAHFNLANVFCMHYGKNSDADLGVPYADKPETTVSPNYLRGTVAELYKKIDADIEAALPLIDDNLYSIPKYHFNKKAAYAFAARFNLYFGNYDKAIKYANEVLGSNPSLVLRDWYAQGKLSNNGSVKTDRYISADNKCNLLNLRVNTLWTRVHGPYSSGTLYTHNTLIARDETCMSTGPWGVYNNLNFPAANYSGLPKVIVRKLNEYFEYTDPVAGIGHVNMVLVAFTTDETLLCRAEANTLLGNFDKAMEDLTSFMRAYCHVDAPSLDKIEKFYGEMEYYTPESPTPKKKLNPDFKVNKGTQENLIHYILHLRRILTLHEGLRWIDIKRYGIDICRRSVDDANNVVGVTDWLKKDDLRRAIQIPAQVVGAGMKPNPRDK